MSKLFPFNRKNRNVVGPFSAIDNFIDGTIGNLPIFNRNVMWDQFKVDVQDLDDKYLVEAEFPGVDKEDIDVRLSDDGRLYMSVDREEKVDEQDEEGNYIHRERRYDSMQRSIYLEDANPEGKMQAKLKDGLLTITVEKQNDKKIEHARKINIE